MEATQTPPFCIGVDPELWDRLGLDNQTVCEVARCAFYLGFGVEAVKELVATPDSADALDVMATAMALGIQPSDSIYKLRIV